MSSEPPFFRIFAKANFHEQDIIITMLPEGKQVKTVYLGPDGVCSGDIGGKLLIDCSTIDTASFLEVKEHVQKISPSTRLYDAPVSGGVIGAMKGSIAFFLGCAEDDAHEIQRLSELLSLMGSKVIPCGGPSFGLAAKLSNNYLSGIIAIACSEAMDMGMRSGLDPRVLAKVYAAGTAQNTICDKFCPVPGVAPEAPSSNGYKNGFKVQLMRKDISLAVEMAHRVNSKNVLGSTALKTYESASMDVRCRDLDSRVVFRYLGGKEDWETDRPKLS
jgi:3-hydroxyisobutyrate dehydrogenase-like beta-hydroxyacid dehydrogenase